MAITILTDDEIIILNKLSQTKPKMTQRPGWLDFSRVSDDTQVQCMICQQWLILELDETKKFRLDIINHARKHIAQYKAFL